MDRDSYDDVPALQQLPSGPVVVSVCITCKSADGSAVVGPALCDSVRTALAADVMVRPVQCLGVCKRPATATVTSPDGYTFVFGDLDTVTGTDALVSFVESYKVSNYGLVPWRQRADALRKGMVARIPPARWSPADGHQPK